MINRFRFRPRGPFFEDGPAVNGQAPAPGGNGDRRVQTSQDGDQPVHLGLSAPDIPQHIGEFEQVQMQGKTDIVQQQVNDIVAAGLAVVEEQGGAPAEAAEVFDDLPHLLHLLPESGDLLPSQVIRHHQDPQQIAHGHDVGIDACFLTEIGDDVISQDGDQGQDPEAGAQEHGTEGRERQEQGHPLAPYGHDFYIIQRFNIIIDGILPGMAQPVQGHLQIQPGFLVPVRETELFLRKGQILRLSGRGPQQVIEIFLAAAAHGRIHGPEKAVHIQVVPGDIVDLAFLPVTRIIAGDLGVALVRHFLAAGLFAVILLQILIDVRLRLLLFPQGKGQAEEDHGTDDQIYSQDCFSLLLVSLGHDMVPVLIDGMGRYTASDHGDRIDIGMAAYHRSRIEDRVAADIGIVAQHGADLAPAGLHLLIAVMDHDRLIVGLDIGGNGTGSHMRMDAQDTVAHIIVMGHLDQVEKDHVLKLGGVAYDRLFAHNGGTADKGALADLGFLINDAGAADVSRIKHFGALCHPDILPALLKSVFGQGPAQLNDKIADAGQGLPGIGHVFEQICCNGLAQVI